MNRQLATDIRSYPSHEEVKLVFITSTFNFFFREKKKPLLGSYKTYPGKSVPAISHFSSTIIREIVKTVNIIEMDGYNIEIR